MHEQRRTQSHGGAEILRCFTTSAFDEHLAQVLMQNSLKELAFQEPFLYRDHTGSQVHDVRKNLWQKRPRRFFFFAIIRAFPIRACSTMSKIVQNT